MAAGGGLERPGRRRRSLLSRTQQGPSPTKGHRLPPLEPLASPHSRACAVRDLRTPLPVRLALRPLSLAPPSLLPHPTRSTPFHLRLPPSHPPLEPLATGPRKSLLGLASGASPPIAPPPTVCWALSGRPALRGMMGMMCAFCTAICYWPALIEFATAARAASRKALLVLR
jgi:hypothetical protein